MIVEYIQEALRLPNISPINWTKLKQAGITKKEWIEIELEVKK